LTRGQSPIEKSEFFFQNLATRKQKEHIFLAILKKTISQLAKFSQEKKKKKTALAHPFCPYLTLKYFIYKSVD
jgi:hypothetical protein